MVDFTVAIPTYNGESRLPEVLDRLRSQVQTELLTWEILVIDNNSSDGTADVVKQYQATWPQAYPLRYSFEPEQGSAFARQRAIEEAQGELVGFLDDDNLPALDWVATAYAFGQAHPHAGAYGSQIHGVYEVEPPENFQQICFFLAIIERGSIAHPYLVEQKILPPGAGLVVRKAAWRQAVPKRLVLNHTGKAAGLASEDLEAVRHIQRAGWEIWYNPDMHVDHKIPRWRLERDYLLKLIRCVGLSRHHIRMLGFQVWQRPFIWPAYLLHDCYKLVRHCLQHRQQVELDLIAACERELLQSSLASPLFLWKVRHLSLLQQSIKAAQGVALRLQTLASANRPVVKFSRQG